MSLSDDPLELPPVTDFGGTGNPIVVLPGAPWCSESYVDFIHLLGSRCLGFELRGQHPCVRMPSSSIPFEQHVSDCILRLERLAGARDVIGHSFGGCIGIAVAARRPELIRSLVLINSRADAIPAPEVEYYIGLLDSLAQKGMSSIADLVMGMMFSPTSLLRNPNAASRWKGYLLRHPPETHWMLRGAIARPSLVPLLTHIRTRVLVQSADNDATTPSTASGCLATHIQQALLVNLPTLGHMSPLEDPAISAAVVREWLGSATP